MFFPVVTNRLEFVNLDLDFLPLESSHFLPYGVGVALATQYIYNLSPFFLEFMFVVSGENGIY